MTSPEEIARLYGVLFSLEEPVSPVLALELRLEDRVGGPESTVAASGQGAAPRRAGMGRAVYGRPGSRSHF